MSHFNTPSSCRTNSRAVVYKTPVSVLNVKKKSLTIPASPAMKKVGFGTGVTVFLYERFSPNRGKFGSPWAVKKVNSKLHGAVPPKKDEESCSTPVRRVQSIEKMCNSRLAAEAKLLCSFNHPNIIGFRDYTTAADGTKCLAMEAGEKDLYSIIEDMVDAGQTDPIPTTALAQVCRDVASALHYLHEEQRLLHGDIKSANLLVKGDFEQVKLCDFGVSLKLDDKMVVAKDQFYIGTECWSPPEAILGMTPVTDRADIFAFGLTIWECLTLDTPHVGVLDREEDEDLLSEEEQKIKNEECEALFQQLIGTRPPLPNTVHSVAEAYAPFIESFHHCTNSDPAERPSASQLVEIFALLDQQSDDIASISPNISDTKDLMRSDNLSSSCLDVDLSVDTEDESLNSSYFTNETLALRSSISDQREHKHDEEENEELKRSTDTSKLSNALSSTTSSTHLHIQENKGEDDGNPEEKKHNEKSLQKENTVHAQTHGDAQGNRTSKRPFPEKNDPEQRKKFRSSSP